MTCRLLIKSASSVLAGHCRLTHLGGVHKRAVPYSARREPHRPTYSLGIRLLLQAMGGRVKTEYASPLRVLRPCWTAFLNSRRMPAMEEVQKR